MQPLLRSGADDVAILAGMSDHMADFKHLIDTAKPGVMDKYHRNESKSLGHESNIFMMPMHSPLWNPI